MMFEKELKAVLANFDLEYAYEVSEALHMAEEGGYEITDEEDELWEALTHRVVLNEQAL